MPAKLGEELEASFSSIATLKRELEVTASSMFGPGFVWLVKNKDKKYSLLTTYLAGSPYPGAHHRKQALDMNTQDEKSVSDHIRKLVRQPAVNTVGSHGPLSEKPNKPPGGIEVPPVLCINTWEHVWLPDYGIGAGGVGGMNAFACTIVCERIPCTTLTLHRYVLPTASRIALIIDGWKAQAF